MVDDEQWDQRIWLPSPLESERTAMLIGFDVPAALEQLRIPLQLSERDTPER